MKKALVLIAVLLIGALCYRYFKMEGDALRAAQQPQVPVWLEADSAAAIKSRLRSDFSLTFEEAAAQVRELHPEVSDDDVRAFIDKHYMEAKTIDDTLRIHRKSPRNLGLLNPDMNGGARYRGDHASATRISYADSVIAFTDGRNPMGGAHSVTYRFTIDVPYNDALAGESLRVWMPLPFESNRQKNVEILSSEPSAYVLSDGRSVHNSIDIAEARKLVALQGYHSLSLLHLRRQILVRALCDTRAAHLCCLCDGCQNGVYILLVRSVGHHHRDVVNHFFTLLFIPFYSLFPFLRTGRSVPFTLFIYVGNDEAQPVSQW